MLAAALVSQPHLLHPTFATLLQIVPDECYRRVGVPFGGISLGCPLSPLMAAFFLHELDERMERTCLFYVRFMDDILVLAPTRWTLRRAVRAVNAVLGALGLEKHPDKTFIGKIERGFDFLGYRFSREGLRVAKATIERFVARATRLYEQEREDREGSSALGMYVRRWNGWVKGGLGGLDVSIPLCLTASSPETSQTQQAHPE